MVKMFLALELIKLKGGEVCTVQVYGTSNLSKLPMNVDSLSSYAH
jgi:hypothetical protein